jgi:hypothetical protein
VQRPYPMGTKLLTTDDIPVETQTTMVTPISHSPAINNNTFSIQLENVSDEIVRNDLEENLEHILSLIKEKTLDVSSIVAPDGASVDPVLQKDLDGYYYLEALGHAIPVYYVVHYVAFFFVGGFCKGQEWDA